MNKHFFLIDDDEDELDIFLEAISKLPIACKCTYASTAEKALDILANLSPDYIFLDINMPKVNGFDCLQKIRAGLNRRDTCIVMYSTGIDEITAAKAKKEGASTCIKKTPSIIALANAIEQLVNSKCNYTNIQEPGKFR